MSENRQPKFYKVMKIIGFIGAAIAVIGLIIGISGAVKTFGSTSKMFDGFEPIGEFSSPDQFLENRERINDNGSEMLSSGALMMIGFSLLGIGAMMAVVGLFVGFSPALGKATVKGIKYMQSETKDDLKDIADTEAEIHGDAISSVVGSIKKGWKGTLYCKHCGKEIDGDSTFCKFCGKSQN